MNEYVDQIRRNLEETLERIDRAAAASGRKGSQVRLVVVTKAQPLQTAEAAIAAGAHDLGENYPEEAEGKILALQSQPVQWHMIGHLQSRKARIVAEHFQMLHSLDSLHLAEKLERLLAETGKTLPALLEFNVGGEESKFGWQAWQEDQWEQLLPELSAVVAMPHLQICGLMTMPPLFTQAEQSRPYFQKLRRLRDFLAGTLKTVDWKELSMGTSADYETAVAEGATLVRVGQAILGPRPPKV